MWLSHWKLRYDPFADTAGSFVPLPSHQEAVARLAHAIERGERCVSLHARAGLGKTRVLDRALAEVRNPARRVARVQCPDQGPDWLLDLARGLGGPPERRPETHSQAWRRLTEAVQLCAWQGLGVVLAIDNCHLLREVDDRRNLKRLVHLAHPAETDLTVIEVGHPDAEGGSAFGNTWGFAVRLPALTRTDADQYLHAKLARAGLEANPFVPAAVTRLHGLACGAPRGIDRLATLCLMATAVQGLSRITPEVVSDAAREFLTPSPWG